MDTPNEEVHASTVEARGAVTGHGVRYVLGISLVLALVVMGVLYMGGTAGPNQSGTAPSEEASDPPSAMAS